MRSFSFGGGQRMEGEKGRKAERKTRKIGTQWTAPHKMATAPIATKK